MLTYVYLAIGLILLFGGGDFLVRGAVAVARRLGVSPLIIGLTLVGFGTSTPELVASLKAALSGAPGIAIGNVVGSNIANVLLILGSAAVITPMLCTRDAFLRDGSVLVGATLLFILLCMSGTIGRTAGLLCVGLLAAFTILTYRADKRRHGASALMHEAEAEAVEEVAGPLWKGLLIAVLGMAAVMLGATLLVDAATDIARAFQLSEAVIGLSVVAIGTSLPELATAVVAAIKRQADVAFGNVVGSNIFNLLGILGTTAAVTPIPVPPHILHFDIWALLAITLLLVGTAVSGWRVSRWEGAVFVALYIGYMTLLFSPGLQTSLGIG